ncbi:Major facilitator superfamily domain-containing protein 6 [Armadillidium vulgare]|nr:Major facilitator superfamily domain-containing protein 6 [Armadillidium vulgare]
METLDFNRMFANLGMMIMSPISGMLIDYFSIQNGFDDFRPAMYMYCALKLIAAVIILFLNLDFKQASNKVISEFSSMLLNPEVVCFLLATLLAGTCYGYIETFLFWLLEDLGADRKLMGLTLTVGCLFGIPLLMISTFILKKIGHVNTIAVGFCVYVVRLLGYTFIPGPWWAMPFEALECATVSLMVVSFMSYASVLSTPATVVTLQGMYGGLYNGVGRGAGSLIGGFLIDRLGMFNAFRIIAALAGCCGIVYFVVNFLFFRGNRQLRDEAMIQEKELRKAKEAEANKQPVNLSKVIESKKEIIKDMFIIAPSDLKENLKDVHSKTNLAFEAHVSLVPFLTLQARSLGINEEEVGIIYSFIPIASLIAPPISGILADKIGNFRILLSAVTASAGLAGLLFLLVPPARIVHTMPNILPIEISCSEGQGANLRIAPPYLCEPESDIDLFSIQVDECTVSCYYTENLENIEALTILDSNLNCKNSVNCYDEDNLIKSNSTSSMPLLDGAAVTILKEHNGDFGFQRMFANLGMMIMSPISGMLIDYFSIQNGFDDFRPAMYMYCALKLIAAVIILFLNLDFKQASNKVISEFSSMLLNPEVVCFLFATLLAGTCYGYIETFLFWLLEDLGADRRLMGLTLTVGCIFGIPLLMISTFILKKIGHVNTIAIGFCVYVVRLLGYTFIPGPWWAMPFEALECATVSLMVVSFMSYASVLSTPATVVTLQGMYGGLYNGVGRGAGSLIGGFLIDRLGMFNAFRIIAALGGCSEEIDNLEMKQ